MVEEVKKDKNMFSKGRDDEGRTTRCFRTWDRFCDVVRLDSKLTLSLASFKPSCSSLAQHRSSSRMGRRLQEFKLTSQCGLDHPIICHSGQLHSHKPLVRFPYYYKSHNLARAPTAKNE
jgi:hypothetical protein